MHRPSLQHSPRHPWSGFPGTQIVDFDIDESQVRTAVREIKNHSRRGRTGHLVERLLVLVLPNYGYASCVKHPNAIDPLTDIVCCIDDSVT